ncbi:MAG: type IV secretory system conjugative DNA transfer family protein [Methylococcales bacterium]
MTITFIENSYPNIKSNLNLNANFQSDRHSIPTFRIPQSSDLSHIDNCYLLGTISPLFAPHQVSRDYLEIKTDKHLLSIAPTRTGKGRGLILPNLLHLPNHSVFVIDPKGENALVSAKYRKEQGHEIIIFNPYGIFADKFKELGFTQFQCFNPLANLDPESDSFTDDVAIIAEALVYDDNGGSKDSHWIDSARGLIEFLITYLVIQENEQATLGRLRSILSGGYSTLEKEVLDKAIKNPNPMIYENVGRYSKDTNEIHSVIATAETQTRILKSKSICSALDGEAFNFEQMKHKKMSVYLVLPSERLVTHARYLRLVLLVAMSQFMRSEKGEHQVLMMLDEFANLGKLNIIEHGYSLIAGHGVTLWSFVQNLTQLQNLYPKNWETFIANSEVVTVSDVNDVTTADYFNRRAGKEEVRKTTSKAETDESNGETRRHHSNTTTNMVWEDSLPVTTLYNAPPYTLFLFFSGQAMPTVCTKLMYDHDSSFKARAAPHPMHPRTIYDEVQL